MSIIYVPVPIESAEQAAELPIGTIAAPIYEDGPDFTQSLVRREGAYEPWCNSDGSHALGHDELDGFVALAPVEAEEEHAIWKSWDDIPNGIGIPVPPDYPFHDLSVGEAVWSRIMTPWKEVAS